MEKRKQNNSLLLLIITLAWPTMLEQFMQTAVQYIDTAMVGTLGRAATAAVGATSTVNWLVGSVVSALGVGFLAYISQAMGRGESGLAKKASAQSVFVTLVTGVVLTAITTGLSPVIPAMMSVDKSIRALASRYFVILYAPMLFRAASIIFGTVLRSVGDTKTPMLVGVVVNVINVILNYFLIYPSRYVRILSLSMHMPGAGLGVEGAAVASAVAYTIGGILITLALYRHKQISFRHESLKPDPKVLRPCFKVALPNMLQRFATSLGYVVFASMINSIGELSTAAHTIANTVESAFYIPGWGMQTAAATIAGNAYGADDNKKLKDLTRYSLIIEASLMVISGALLFIFSPSLMSLFSADAEVIRLGAVILRMVAVSEPFYGIAIVLEGMMQGVGNTRLPFGVNVAGMWGIRILGTLIFTVLLGYGLIAAWGCMIAHNVFLFAVFALVFALGKWKPRFGSLGANAEYKRIPRSL